MQTCRREQQRLCLQGGVRGFPITGRTRIAAMIIGQLAPEFGRR